jgi:hypothetical protein
MSLDRDASDRTFDRQLAYLGLLDDAAPIFREGSSVPGAGVLLKGIVIGAWRERRSFVGAELRSSSGRDVRA